MRDSVAVRLADGSLWGVDGIVCEDVRDVVASRDWIVASGPLYRETATVALIRTAAVVAVVKL